MKNSQELKSIVTEKYDQIARAGGSCCGEACACAEEVNFIGDSYVGLDGYIPEADLGLGCGLPTEHASIKEGDVVVDLGSGAGNDCFVARSIVGPYGKVIGIDFTKAMVEKATSNAGKLKYKNVHFVEGDIENIPLSENTADVVVSNCVLNLVPDKEAAFAETFRILKPGGHFSISDIVVKGNLPGEFRESAEMYAGCVSGAVSKEAYLSIIRKSGFNNISVQKESKISIPEEILKNILTSDQLKSFRKENFGVYSITVYGEKPGECCDPGCCN